MRRANYFAWSLKRQKGTHNPLVAGSSPARPTLKDQVKELFVRADYAETGHRPQIVRSRIESVRNGVQIIGEQVPVAVQRQRRRLVPK